MNNAEELHALKGAAERTRIAMGALNDEISYLRDQNDALKAAIAALLKPYPAGAQERILRAVRAEADDEQAAPVAPPPGPPTPCSPAEREEFEQRPIRFLADLRTYDLAPRAASMKRDGKWLAPYWMPPATHIVDQVRYSHHQWKTVDWDQRGPLARLDRSGAHVASASSVRVAFGALIEQEEPVQWAGLPGYYRVLWAPWDEDGTPHPLGGAAKEAARVGSVWVPHTRVKLLADLAVAGRWPELGPMPAWVAEHDADMHRWAQHVNAARGEAIDTYGRDSMQYKAVKESFSMACSLMIGTRDAGQGHREWACDVQRPDWAHAIRDLSACTMWRWCDDLRYVAIDADRPEWAPVAIQNQDELWVPEAAVELFTTTARRKASPMGKPRRPLVIDETGKTLGTWKVKAA